MCYEEDPDRERAFQIFEDEEENTRIATRDGEA